MDPTNNTPYVNRELSLLAFQERVFALAVAPDRPLLERVKFIAIVSSNLDEFHQVRVAGLLEQAESGVTTSGPDGLTPRQQLAAIHERVTALSTEIDRLFNEDVRPTLAVEGIEIVDYVELGVDDRTDLDAVFEDSIFPVLTPLAVDPSHPFPFISDLSLNLAVLLSDPGTKTQRFARVKIPPNVPRFIRLADGHRFVPIEQIVSHHLGRLFGGLDVVSTSTFRVTRSADLAVEEEEASDLLRAIESELRYRQRAAQAVRLEVEDGIAENVLELLLHGLQLTRDEVYVRHAPLGLAGLWSVYSLDRPDLKEHVVAADDPAEARRTERTDRRLVCRTAQGRHPRSLPVRILRHIHGFIPRSSCRRSGCPRDQADALPHVDTGRSCDRR